MMKRPRSALKEEQRRRPVGVAAALLWCYLHKLADAWVGPANWGCTSQEGMHLRRSGSVVTSGTFDSRGEADRRSLRRNSSGQSGGNRRQRSSSHARVGGETEALGVGGTVGGPARRRFLGSSGSRLGVQRVGTMAVVPAAAAESVEAAAAAAAAAAAVAAAEVEVISEEESGKLSTSTDPTSTDRAALLIPPPRALVSLKKKWQWQDELEGYSRPGDGAVRQYLDTALSSLSKEELGTMGAHLHGSQLGVGADSWYSVDEAQVPSALYLEQVLFFKTLGLGRAAIRAVLIVRCKRLFSETPEYLRNLMGQLENYVKLTHPQIAQLMLRDARLLCSSTDSIGDGDGDDKGKVFTVQSLQRLRSSIGLSNAQLSRLILTLPILKALAEDMTSTEVKPNRKKVRDLLQLTVQEALEMELMYPAMFSFHVDKYLVPKLQWLQDVMQIDRKQLKKVIRRTPCLTGLSIEKNLHPTMEALKKELRLTNLELVRIIRHEPEILNMSWDNNVRPKIKWLRDRLTLTEAELRRMVSMFPSLLVYNVETNMTRKVDYLSIDLGLTQKYVKRTFKSFPAVFGYSILENMEPKLWYLQLRLGFESREQTIRRTVVTQPALWGLSRANIEAKLSFYEEEMGASLEQLRRTMTAMSTSVEQRLRPRVACMRHAGITPTYVPHRSVVAKLTDKAFDEWMVENEGVNPRLTYMEYLTVFLGMEHGEACREMSAYPRRWPFLARNEGECAASLADGRDTGKEDGGGSEKTRTRVAHRLLQPDVPLDDITTWWEKIST